MAALDPNNADKRKIGFDCEFVEPPSEKYVQSECPVCLQIIREPHQVTCCGKKFCKACIGHIKVTKNSCPTCNEEKFSNFPDKGVKQLLYDLKVHCSHQKDGCEWTGELRQLDEHLNTDPQPEKKFEGCQFVEIDCFYECENHQQRRYIKLTKMTIAPNVHSVVSTAILTSLPMMMSPTTTGLCVGLSLSPALTSVVQLSNVRI